jgi:hypothetical protein
MIDLGLRLTLKGGREAVARLAVTAAAVMLGVAMLLLVLGGINAVNSQNARYAWLETGHVAGTPAATGADAEWWLLRADYYRGELIGRADLAATGPHSPVPPGIPRLPGPGEYYASPAMAKLLRTVPAAELADRFHGHLVGIVGSVALPAPDSLIIVVGNTVAEISQQPDVQRIDAFNTVVPSSCGECAIGVGINANGIDLILSVVAVALLFPVLMFIGSASRLSAARREQRFAAMRLAGATPRQIAAIATVESSVAAVGGMLAGFLVFFLVRAPFAAIPFTGAPFFAHDVTVSLADVVAVAVGVPVAAAVVARLALRRVQVSPLGVSRRTSARVARAYRGLPLLAGLGELLYFVDHGRPQTSVGQIEAYLGGIVLVMIGLVLVGPWLTMVAARALSRRTSSPVTLIAGRRLSDNPQAAFRAISGLVLALFVTSTTVAVIDAVVAEAGGTRSGGPATTLVQEFREQPDEPAPVVDPSLVTRLTALPGVRGVTVVHADGRPWQPGMGDGAVAACADLTRTATIGSCPPGAQVAEVSTDYSGRDSDLHQVWPVSTVPLASLSTLAVRSVVVGTDGPATVERARTLIEAAYAGERWVPNTVGEDQVIRNRETRQYEQLATVVLLTSLPVAGVSLAVTVAAGLGDRKRPFSLLRLTGVPVAMLRRVVAAETVVPLLAGALVAIAMGFLSAQLFLTSQLHYDVQPPGLGYYLAVVAGLLVCLVVLASTFPLLSRITGPEAARQD